VALMETIHTRKLLTLNFLAWKGDTGTAEPPFWGDIVREDG